MLDPRDPVEASNQACGCYLSHLGRIRYVDFQIKIIAIMERSRVVGTMLTSYADDEGSTVCLSAREMYPG